MVKVKYGSDIFMLLDQTIILVTDDFNLVYRVYNLIHDLHVLHKMTFDEITEEDRVITDKPIPPHLKQSAHRIGRTTSDTEIRRIITSLWDQEGALEIVIGIDPGVSIGIVVLANNQILDSTVVMKIDNMVRWIRKQLQELDWNHSVIRVGDGWKMQLDILLLRLYREFRSSSAIELVNEERTSVRRSSRLSIHEQAATIIAQRKGRPYRPPRTR